MTVKQWKQFATGRRRFPSPKRGSVPQGGTLNFSSYVSSGQAYTLHPQKYQEFQAPQKIFEILATPKNIPTLYNDLKKRP